MDASGGGDFTQISDAVASPSVVAGDRLLILPGIYGPFTLAKNLTIVGLGVMPRVTGLSTIQTPEGATLSNLTFQRLQLLDCGGIVLLDRVNVIDVVGLGCPTFLIRDCETVLAGIGVFRGQDGDGSCTSEGLVVHDATVVLTQCHVYGGAGADDPASGQDGVVAVRLESGADVNLSHVDVEGGAGGAATAPGGTGGDGAPALAIALGADGLVIGHMDSFLQGGGAGAGDTPGLPAQLAVSGSGALTLSGTEFLPPVLDPALQLVLPDPPLSFVRMIPFEDPGPDRQLQVFGDPGALLWLLASIGTARIELPGLVEEPLYLDPTVSFLFVPITALGLSNPVSFDFDLPSDPALIGLVASFQAFTAQSGPVPWHASNPAHIVVE